MAGAISSTGRKDYCTPGYIVEAVRDFFRKLRNDPAGAGITLDPSSNPKSMVMASRNIMVEDEAGTLQAKVNVTTELISRRLEMKLIVDKDLPPPWPMQFLTGDGLTMSWAGECVYNNPPFGYSKVTKIGIKNWINKALAEAATPGTEIIQCLPDTPETAPWKNGILLKAQGRCQLRQRVKFVGMKQGIPKPISLVYFGGSPDLFKECFKFLGRVENPSVVYADQADIKL